jgi:hypothetical protein
MGDDLTTGPMLAGVAIATLVGALPPARWIERRFRALSARGKFGVAAVWCLIAVLASERSRQARRPPAFCSRSHPLA